MQHKLRKQQTIAALINGIVSRDEIAAELHAKALCGAVAVIS
jgi:hypothetical protein